MMSKSSNSITQYNDQNSAEDALELRFRSALDNLLDVYLDKDSSSDIKVQRMLDIGLDYYSMQSGLLGSVMGNDMELIGTCGELAKIHKVSDTIPLVSSLCLVVLDTDSVIAEHKIAQSPSTSVTQNTASSCQSFIGTQVLTHNGPLGIISYSSSTGREHPFTGQDKRLITLVASWIGSILGNEEQLEFLSLQNDYYQSLFRTVPAMMMLCNRDGLILSTSDRLSNSIGIDPLSVPGKNCHRFFIESDAPAIDRALELGDVDHLPLTLRYDNGETLDVLY